MGSVLDRQEIEVVRAKYIKEIAVTNRSDTEIAFGSDKVTVGEVEKWLAKKARANSRWIMIAGIASVVAALAAIAAVVITLVK